MGLIVACLYGFACAPFWYDLFGDAELDAAVKLAVDDNLGLDILKQQVIYADQMIESRRAEWGELTKRPSRIAANDASGN